MIGNSASTAGGAIYSRYDGSYIYNNTIASNTANEGGGIYVLTFSYLPPTIYNSIIWDNSAVSGPSIFLYTGTGSTANVNYCDVEGGWAGTGNIDDYPYFTSGSGGNYYLSDDESGQIFDSPCIDAGDPTSALIEGTTRTDGELDVGVVDMGFHYPPGGTLGWLDIGMNPGVYPIHIPAGGGAFDFEVGIINVGGEGMWFDIWTLARLPNGSLYGPTKLVQNIWISSLENIFRQNIVQWVPANAPAGDYQYICNVGEYPDYIIDSDSISFDKLAGETVIDEVKDWSTYGWGKESESSFKNRTPRNYSILKTYPNPFNPILTMEFVLPEVSDVKLTICNSTGEQVTELINTTLTTGTHIVNWNANNEASGLYFVRFKYGNYIRTEKCLLIR